MAESIILIDCEFNPYSECNGYRYNTGGDEDFHPIVQARINGDRTKIQDYFKIILKFQRSPADAAHPVYLHMEAVSVQPE